MRLGSLSFSFFFSWAWALGRTIRQAKAVAAYAVARSRMPRGGMGHSWKKDRYGTAKRPLLHWIVAASSAAVEQFRTLLAAATDRLGALRRGESGHSPRAAHHRVA